jgi:hypothetical protein
MDSEGSFGQGASINPPAGLNGRWSFTDSAANYLSATLGDKLQSLAGASGTMSMTTTKGSSQDNLIGAQVALDPKNANSPQGNNSLRLLLNGVLR